MTETFSPSLSDEQRKQFRKTAERMYANGSGEFSDGDINVDDDALVSESSDGAYVQAWVWVPQEEVDNAARASHLG